jgi:hypothetical protein
VSQDAQITALQYSGSDVANGLLRISYDLFETFRRVEIHSNCDRRQGFVQSEDGIAAALVFAHRQADIEVL